MQVIDDQDVLVRIESISPEVASELLSKSGLPVSEILGMDTDKVARFMSVMCGDDGRWYPAMSAIWIDPDGRLRDGFHRLQAAAALGCEIEVFVARGAVYTPERMSEVDRAIKVAQQEIPEFDLRPTVPGSFGGAVRCLEELRAQSNWAMRLAARLIGSKKRRLGVWTVRLIVGMLRLALRTRRL